MKNELPVVILDPGHGGMDPETKKYVTPGKRSNHPVDDQIFYEGVNNRITAKEWGTILQNLGFKVEFTVTPDNYRDICRIG